MEFDPLMLARMQFAANVTFHILFPSISIALSWVLLFFKIRYRQTNDQSWMDSYGFWVKIFALSFAMGVVSGVTMSFQFGTNWPGYMNTVGNLAGPLLGYEVLTAFFLEATFLGVMLFGRSRVSERLHTWATFLVALGTTLSAFWILVLDSWMQTPDGFTMINGKAVVTSWVHAVFNPSLPYRFFHMLLASGLTVSFLVAGISAYRMRKGDRSSGVKKAVKTGVTLASVLIVLQIIAGDFHGLNTFAHQPAKLAAIEGVWHTESGSPLLLFALPNSTTEKNDYAIGIPRLSSLIVTHSWNGTIRGVTDFADHPPVPQLFWAFRIMVLIGVLMLLASWISVWTMRKGRELPPCMQRILFWMTFSGWVATVAGWYVTEIGRQPWLVEGVLRTQQAVGAATHHMLWFTLAMYVILYIVLLVCYLSVVFYMAHKAATTTSGDDAIKIDTLKEKYA